MTSPAPDLTYDILDARLQILLPADYQDCYEDLQPIPMRAAGLKFDSDGKVAWNEIWGSFCDLAMAGGPPHKGALLSPGSARDIAARPEGYAEVTTEIVRGITLVTGLAARVAGPGWIHVPCLNDAMAGWLLRAITMENVAVRATGPLLELPAAPHFRLEREIKNVVTVIAKTCHYWVGHMPGIQRRAIANLFAEMAAESPLITPADDIPDPARLTASSDRVASAIHQATGLPRAALASPGWLGIDCRSVNAAVWLMRSLVVQNVLARRENTALCVPVNPTTDPDGALVTQATAAGHRLALSRGVMSP